MPLAEGPNAGRAKISPLHEPRYCDVSVSKCLTRSTRVVLCSYPLDCAIIWFVPSHKDLSWMEGVSHTNCQILQLYKRQVYPQVPHR